MINPKDYELCYTRNSYICKALNILDDRFTFTFTITNDNCNFYMNEKPFYSVPYRFFLSCHNMFIVRLLSDKFIKGV